MTSVKATAVLALVLACALLAGCSNSNNSSGASPNNSNVPASSGTSCPDSLTMWTSKIAFGAATTTFSATDPIFVTVNSSVACADKVNISFYNSAGSGFSQQAYNIPAGMTGYYDYNPQKNLQAGGYYFEVRYGGALVKTIQITITAGSSQSGSGLSEEPNATKFAEYFSDAYLGKLPLGVQVGPPNFPTKTTTFTSADQFCTNLEIIKAIPANSYADAIYCTTCHVYKKAKTTFPMALATGGTSGCEPLPVSAGSYEEKIYIDDVLVAVLPFEVE